MKTHLQIRFKNLGTDNIVTVFVAILTISNDLRNLFKSFNYAKLGQFAVGLIQYASLVSVARQALAEFRQLTPDKAQIIEQKVREQFDIEDDRFEEAIEDALELVVDTYEWVQDGAGLGRRYVGYYEKYIQPSEEAPAPPIPDRAKEDKKAA